MCACRKDLESYDANYKGEWHSRDPMTSQSSGKDVEIYLLVNGDQSEYGFMCEINCTACPCDLLTSGKIKINSKNKKIIVGSGNNKRRVRLTINESPHLNAQGKWECKLNDIVMIKD